MQQTRTVQWRMMKVMRADGSKPIVVATGALPESLEAEAARLRVSVLESQEELLPEKLQAAALARRCELLRESVSMQATRSAELSLRSGKLQARSGELAHRSRKLRRI